jgi:hypothetical protein
MLFDASLFDDRLVGHSGTGVKDDSCPILEGDSDGLGTINGGQQVNDILGQFEDGGLVFHGKLRQMGGDEKIDTQYTRFPLFHE